MALEPLNSCIVCGARRAAPHLIQSGYQLWRCASCGFVFVSPTPSAAELAAYYATRYAVPLARDADHPARHAARLADLERWVPERGTLLEVGASHGFFLAQAQQRGWHVAGVELAPDAAAHAREALGLSVFGGDLLDAPLPPASFDAAVLWHVLEHTQDPVAQIGRLRALLRPGGVLGLRVPNIASVGARWAGRAWPWISPPAHLWYFDPQTLPRLLARLGFVVIEVATLRGDGNNRYQHALAGAGSRLSGALRRARRRTSVPPTEPQSAQSMATMGPQRRSVQLWLAALRRAQPLTDALDRIGPDLDASHGDELLVYARVPQ